jgi:hypothetical protein
VDQTDIAENLLVEVQLGNIPSCQLRVTILGTVASMDVEEGSWAAAPLFLADAIARQRQIGSQCKMLMLQIIQTFAGRFTEDLYFDYRLDKNTRKICND